MVKSDAVEKESDYLISKQLVCTLCSLTSAFTAPLYTKYETKGSFTQITIFLALLNGSPCAFEPQNHKMSVRPAKTQISLGICLVWSESSLCTQWVAKDPSFLYADNKDSDQTGRMPSFIFSWHGQHDSLLMTWMKYFVGSMCCWYGGSHYKRWCGNNSLQSPWLGLHEGNFCPWGPCWTHRSVILTLLNLLWNLDICMLKSQFLYDIYLKNEYHFFLMFIEV